MTKPKFDPDATFKSIIGDTEETEQGENNEIKEAGPRETSKETARLIIDAKAIEEKKTKRISLVLKPSTHAKAISKCKELNISLNDCISQLLEIWINQEGE